VSHQIDPVVALIREILDWAREMHNLKSDRELAEMFGRKRNAISDWRNGRGLGPARILVPLAWAYCRYRMTQQNDPS
jgi:hypothetical protein